MSSPKFTKAAGAKRTEKSRPVSLDPGSLPRPAQTLQDGQRSAGGPAVRSWLDWFDSGSVSSGPSGAMTAHEKLFCLGCIRQR